MKTVKLRATLSATVLALGLFNSGISTAAASELQISLEEGQVICFLSSVFQPEGQKIAKTYFQNVIPITAEVGSKYVGGLAIKKVLAGSHHSTGFGIITLPNEDVKVEINERRLPEWIEYRRMRPSVWKELRLRDFTAKQNAKYQFSSDKIYVVESYWIKQDREELFEDSMSASLANAKEQYNGEVIVQFGSPERYETLGMERSPDYFLITEWNNESQYETYVNSKAYKTFKSNIAEGVAGHNAWLTFLPEKKAS